MKSVELVAISEVKEMPALISDSLLMTGRDQIFEVLELLCLKFRIEFESYTQFVRVLLARDTARHSTLCSVK